MSDTEPPNRVALACPACSPEFETVHETLSAGSGQVTVRCTECDHVHKTTLPDERTVDLAVVISQDGESFDATVDAPADERLAVGEEFVAETDEAIMTVRITSLELPDGERVENARAEDVATAWTRAVGNVTVNATVHPTDGRRDETKSVEFHVPGDYEFTVGDTDELGEYEFTVEGIHIRDDATGYDYEKLDYDGDRAAAKDVKRLLVRDESTTAWSAW